ncbi:MAG: hypothetical protein R2681_04990 [Pyrinomonadaceae bacterium]
MTFIRQWKRRREIELWIANSGASIKRTATLELMDQDGNVRSKVSQELNIRSGKSRHRMTIPLGGLANEDDERFLWYRLRYSIGDSTGIVSLTELVRDVFELRVVASNYIQTGKNFSRQGVARNARDNESGK